MRRDGEIEVYFEVGGVGGKVRFVGFRFVFRVVFVSRFIVY